MKVIYGITAFIIILFIVVIGCERYNPFEPVSEQESGQAAKIAGAAVGIERAMAVQNEHSPGLMVIPDVLGIATGLRADGKPAVVVLTRMAGVAGIPRILDGVPVIVKVTGEIKALKKPPWAGGGGDEEEVIDPTSRFKRPVPIGVSTGHPNITAGTIGARVTDGSNVYALSNNHVYADKNEASIGDNVLQPGSYDGGIDQDDAIGTLADFEPINFDGTANVIDAAIALCSTGTLGNATQSDGYGTPKSTTVTASIGLKVKKYGRTTSLTKGRVSLINATIKVNYGGDNIAVFENQIGIEPGGFSEGGDSGSLVVVDGVGRDKKNDRKSVGLVFAGNFFYTFANPIDPVLNSLGVTIDGE